MNRAPNFNERNVMVFLRGQFDRKKERSIPKKSIFNTRQKRCNLASLVKRNVGAENRPNCLENDFFFGQRQPRWRPLPSVGWNFFLLRVEFSLKTGSGYPRDAEVTLFALAHPGSSLRFNTHWSAPPVSALARSGGPRRCPSHQSHVTRT